MASRREDILDLSRVGHAGKSIRQAGILSMVKNILLFYFMWKSQSIRASPFQASALSERQQAEIAKIVRR
jgi:hypothetical protein